MLRTLHEPGSEGGRSGGQNLGTYLVRRDDGFLCVRKILSRSSTRDELMAHREVRALKLLKRYRHPYLNTFAGAQEVEYHGRPAMDLFIKYCDLGDLDNVIIRYDQRREMIPESFIWHVFACMARALALCHFGANDFGSEPPQADFDYIIHNDIKPKNIFFYSHPERVYPVPVLGDFGGALTKAQVYRRRRGDKSVLVVYTPGFDAPDQKSFMSPKVDVFALAITIMTTMGAKSFKDQSSLREHNLGHYMNKLFSTEYSPHLKKVVRAVSDLDRDSRPSSVALIEMIRKGRRAATKAGYIPHEDDAENIPYHFFTRHKERQPLWTALGESPTHHPRADALLCARRGQTQRREWTKQRESSNMSKAGRSFISKLSDKYRKTIASSNMEPPSATKTEPSRRYTTSKTKGQKLSGKVPKSHHMAEGFSYTPPQGCSQRKSKYGQSFSDLAEERRDPSPYNATMELESFLDRESREWFSYHEPRRCEDSIEHERLVNQMREYEEAYRRDYRERHRPSRYDEAERGSVESTENPEDIFLHHFNKMGWPV